MRNIYQDFYEKILQEFNLNQSPGNILELGSGAGFFKELHPNIITSEIIASPVVDIFCSALSLPFRNNSLQGISMINVFHHIPKAVVFLREIERVLVSGGRMVMIEPAKTQFSLFVYKNIHHEPFIVDTGWHFESSGPLSDANGALPWIVFERDLDLYSSQFPNLAVDKIVKHTPFRFLVSGGLSKPQLLPDKFYRLVELLEEALSPLNNILSMFMTLVITKVK